jgi:hypothetical protein
LPVFLAGENLSNSLGIFFLVIPAVSPVTDSLPCYVSLLATSPGLIGSSQIANPEVAKALATLFKAGRGDEKVAP